MLFSWLLAAYLLPHAWAGGSSYNPDRLVVADEVMALQMRHNETFDRASTFVVHGNTLLVPAVKQPKIGLWRLGAFMPTYIAGAKTSCSFSKQTNYYLPGNNRFVFTSKTVDECKQLCCADDMCQSFDYARAADANGQHGPNTCWLSNFKEGAAGITWDPSGIYDYYEVEMSEVLNKLAVVSTGATTQIVAGSALHSGNLYLFNMQTPTAGDPSLAPLGAYVPASTSATGHHAPVLAMAVAAWASGNLLVTGGYDHAVIIWAVESGQLVVKRRITGFSWPVWAVEPGADLAEGIFAAGDHANFKRWSLSGTGDLTAADAAETLSGHSRLIRCLAFDSAHSILASGSEDTRIILWNKDATTGLYVLGATLFDHTETVKDLTFGTPAAKSLLMSSGDDGDVMIFDPKSDDTTCTWVKQLNYYLPGNNRYVFEDSTLAECLKICCESYWCASFDYATEADPGGLHGANTCWMSTLVEGASGLQWDGSGIYHYYEIAKRGTRMLKMTQPGPVSQMSYVPNPTNLMVVEHSGDGSNEGGIFFFKMKEVQCPDGNSPNYEGTECIQCRLGFAGTGGMCQECPPGKFAPAEGSTQCEDCPMGFASSITETPRDAMIEDLWGLVKCTQCPKWSLSTLKGQNFCEWCPPGTYPDEDRATCVGMKSGSDTTIGKTDWTETWRADSPGDLFCPAAGGQSNDGCMYPPSIVQQATCPMTCPRNYQVEVNDDWNPKGWRGGFSLSFTTHFDVGWKCLIQNQTSREMCNKLLCMGKMVSYQGLHEKEFCVKDRTDCTCAEDLRQSCMGGMRRLQEEQCRAQCSPRWCELMCQRERAKESMGLFKPDQVENPFEVLRCEAKGTECHATCKNQQRRVSTSRLCGEFDIWDPDAEKFLMVNDALCGVEAYYKSEKYTSCNGQGGCSTHTREVYTGTGMSQEVCATGRLNKVEKPAQSKNHDFPVCPAGHADRFASVPSALMALALVLVWRTLG
mmetsp:Transcript_31701/g.67403  ORF Transcript_31701/g.67403 Transcript_31701/m.67403 type:complete len:976 (-) Transcript_31701:25-2952(-)